VFVTPRGYEEEASPAGIRMVDTTDEAHPVPVGRFEVVVVNWLIVPRHIMRSD